MRRTALIVALLGACAAAASFAQDWDSPQFLQRAGLSEKEGAEVTRVFEETETAIREARLEVDLLKAQLRKLLFAENVQMPEVERLLRASLEWELKERMAQIRRQVELRRILGDRRYARLTQQVRERARKERGAEDAAPGGGGAPKSKP
jgi:hypothetical protein